MSANQTKSHRLSLQRTSDGKTTVSIDIFGPIGNPLEGLPLRDKLLLLLRPYGSNERALMRAVKGLPDIARRAVAADILAARREAMMNYRLQRRVAFPLKVQTNQETKQLGSEVSIDSHLDKHELLCHETSMT